MDPSIATAALGLGPQDLINDLNTMGQMFENLCIRDLRVYAEALDGMIYHFRESSELECDAEADPDPISLKDLSWNQVKEYFTKRQMEILNQL